MGRKPLKGVAKQTVMEAKREIDKLRRSINQYRPVIVDCIMLGQHLWVTSDKWLTHDDSTESAEEQIKTFKIVRKFHEDFLLSLSVLDSANKQLSLKRKSINSDIGAIEVMSDIMGDLFGIIQETSNKIVLALEPLADLHEKYKEVLKEKVGEKFEKSISVLTKDVHKYADDVRAQIEDMNNVDDKAIDDTIKEMVESVINEEPPAIDTVLTVDETEPVTV